MHDALEGELELAIARPEDVWKHVRITEIGVCRRGHGDRALYVQVAAECDWDGEHGLQLVYRRGGELNRVSDQDGHLTTCDAEGLPESEDRIS